MDTIDNPEVDAIIRNNELRNALEPYFDDDFKQVHLPLEEENDYLESMLEWERSAVKPISQWFEPELCIPSPSSLKDDEIHDELIRVLQTLYQKKIVLDFAEHISDRELYTIVFREILPHEEKYLEHSIGERHWDCSGLDTSSDCWLTYYASDDDRQLWEQSTGEIAPTHLPLPYPRLFPAEPLY